MIEVISNGCYYEIKLAMKLNKNIRLFSVGKIICAISEISIDKLEYEQELKDEYDIKEFQEELEHYI